MSSLPVSADVVKCEASELGALRKANLSLVRAQSALHSKVLEMEKDSLAIGVLLVSPRIHVRVLSAFICELPAAHKCAIHSRYSSAPGMHATGQVFNVLYSLLLLCAKAKNASVPKRSSMQTRLAPYVRYICRHFLEGGSRLMAESEFVAHFHAWLLCCHSKGDATTATEQRSVDGEMQQLRIQLARAKKEKEHLRKQSMLEVKSLRGELRHVLEAKGSAESGELLTEVKCPGHAKHAVGAAVHCEFVAEECDCDDCEVGDDGSDEQKTDDRMADALQCHCHSAECKAATELKRVVSDKLTLAQTAAETIEDMRTQIRTLSKRLEAFSTRT